MRPQEDKEIEEGHSEEIRTMSELSNIKYYQLTKGPGWLWVPVKCHCRLAVKSRYSWELSERTWKSFKCSDGDWQVGQCARGTISNLRTIFRKRESRGRRANGIYVTASAPLPAA